MAEVLPNDPLDLLLALGPLLLRGAALALDLALHGGERLNDSLDALAELVAREALVEELHLLAFALGGGAGVRDLDELLAQRDGEGRPVLGVCDPDTVDAVRTWSAVGRKGRSGVTARA
jgi:hypothetical protein